jgi:hypothetical protein
MSKLGWFFNLVTPKSFSNYPGGRGFFMVPTSNELRKLFEIAEEKQSR